MIPSQPISTALRVSSAVRMPLIQISILVTLRNHGISLACASLVCLNLTPC
jgi:hypothetical protein